MNITHNEIVLIINYLEGNISDDQLNDFFAWIKKDKENEAFFFEIKNIYQSSKSELEASFDVNHSWSRMEMKIKAKIEEKERSEQKTKVFVARIKQTYAYAAAIVAIILISSIYFFIAEPNADSQLQTFRYDNQIGYSSLYLPDGTLVKLASNSKIEYTSDFGKHNRTVDLDGEALFEVARNKEKPFIVQSGAQKIEVLGTKFNVQTYLRDSLFITTLFEGSIKMSTGKESHILKPGEQTVYNTRNGKVLIQDFKESEVLSWTSGYYVFHRKPLPTILNRMGKVYGVDFVIESSEVSDEVLSGTFYQGQDLDNFLKVLKPVTGFNYEVKGKKVIVKK